MRSANPSSVIKKMFMVLYSAARGRRPASERPRRGGVVCVTPRDYLCHAMNATVDALIPLSFLEAVRSVDSPDGDLEAEFVAELRTKRFGLSDTVYAQIRRYGDMVKRGIRPAHGGSGRARDAHRPPPRRRGRLPRRRPLCGARDVCAHPGHHAPGDRGTSHRSSRVPWRSRRRARSRSDTGAASFAAPARTLILEVESSVTVDSAPNSLGCTYYEESLHELLRLLGATSGRVDHVRCAARNEGRCEWRVDWRNLSAA